MCSSTTGFGTGHEMFVLSIDLLHLTFGQCGKDSACQLGALGRSSTQREQNGCVLAGLLPSPEDVRSIIATVLQTFPEGETKVVCLCCVKCADILFFHFFLQGKCSMTIVLDPTVRRGEVEIHFFQSVAEHKTKRLMNQGMILQNTSIFGASGFVLCLGASVSPLSFRHEQVYGLRLENDLTPVFPFQVWKGRLSSKLFASVVGFATDLPKESLECVQLPQPERFEPVLRKFFLNPNDLAINTNLGRGTSLDALPALLPLGLISIRANIDHFFFPKVKYLRPVERDCRDKQRRATTRKHMRRRILKRKNRRKKRKGQYSHFSI